MTSFSRSLHLQDEHWATGIFVLDGSPQIEDIENLVRRELRFALPQDHEDTFMALVWDWWYRLIVRLLKEKHGRVSALQLRRQIDDFRDGFTRESLPTLVPETALSDEQLADYLDRVFVHQLRWVQTPPKVLQKSIIDYYRAVTQTARWLEDDLIASEELERFERNLVDEWERQFDFAVHELPDDADEETKRKVGLALLRRTLDQTSIAIRERYNEPFFAGGVHHDLADRTEIGWHPEFRRRVENLLLAVGE